MRGVNCEAVVYHREQVTTKQMRQDRLAPWVKNAGNMNKINRKRNFMRDQLRNHSNVLIILNLNISASSFYE
jgi:hypothetical protein